MRSRLWSHRFLAGLRLQQAAVASITLTAVGVWWLIHSMGADTLTEQWLWIETVFIPFGVLLSVEPFVGLYERGGVEPLLSRVSARVLYVTTTIPLMLILLFASAALGATTSAEYGGLAAAGRCLILLGFTHIPLVITRSRWAAISAFSVWWFFGLVYMTEWATTDEHPTLLFHPMRVSGGRLPDPVLEGATLVLGLSALFCTWIFIGSDRRWLT